MAIQLNIADGVNTTSSFNVAGRKYRVNFRLNSSDDSWRMSLYDTNGSSILTGMKCIPSQSLTGRYSRDIYDLPDGNFWCFDTEPSGISGYVDSSDFGRDKRFQIWYLPSSEEEDNGLI